MPLSSDAFSKFGHLDAEEHNEEVRQAHSHMTQIIIPQYAQEVLQSSSQHNSLENMLQELHRRGVNWLVNTYLSKLISYRRYLGLFYKNIVSKSSMDSGLAKLVLSEMAARSAKQILVGVRKTTLSDRLRSPGYKLVTSNFFNLLFSNSTQGKKMWTFEDSLSSHNNSNSMEEEHQIVFMNTKIDTIAKVVSSFFLVSTDKSLKLMAQKYPEAFCDTSPLSGRSKRLERVH